MTTTTQAPEASTTRSIDPCADDPIDRTLLRPIRLNAALDLKNRLIMAPMTRSMASDDLVITEASARYYARRAAAGLLITEATIVRADGQGYPNTPGIWSEAQVEGWRRVTDAVHAEGGKIFVQLWHVGRVSHPFYLDGGQPIGPSAVPLDGRVPRTDDLQYGTPRALDAEELPGIVEAFARGAANAIRAGFDGVEIHGANGYLLDQFLHHHTNRRTDDYGGSAANMARFPLEVIDAVIEAIGDATGEPGARRVGLRLSPGAYFNMTGDPRDVEVFEHVLSEVEWRRLAYLHVGVFDDGMTFDELGGSTAGAFLRRRYRGTLIGNGSYSAQVGAEAIEAGQFDLLAIGRPFIANPDLVGQLERGESLVDYDAEMLETLD
ncbi:MAG: alkene reductase [Acidobacteriota bacterium]